MSSKAKKIAKHIEKSHPMSKEAQKVYEDIASSLVLIGNCSCGSGLFLSMKDKNPFAYHCFECGSTNDVRVPSRNHRFNKTQISENETITTPLQAMIYSRKKLKNEDISDEMVKTFPLAR